MQVNMERQGYRELYDIAGDVTESYSVAQTHPDVATEMQGRIERARERFAPFRKGVPPYIQELVRSGAYRQQD
jgi:hypothetical protein